MHPDKTSGPDGFNPAFFQHFWELLGKEVFKYCQQWLIEGKFPNNVNDTTLVLIPKKDQVDDERSNGDGVAICVTWKRCVNVFVIVRCITMNKVPSCDCL